MKKFLQRFWPLNIRLQLTAWYTTVFAVLLLFTGAFFYQHLETSLDASLDSSLQIRAQQIASEIVTSNGELTLHDLTLNPSGQTLKSQVTQPGNVDYGEMVRLLNGHGTVLQETPAFSTLNVPNSSIEQSLQGNPWQGTARAGRDVEIRIYSRALLQQGHVIAVIQVGETLVPLDQLLHDLVGELLVVGALALLVCALGSYWLAARAFAPIRHLAQVARHIKADDLQQRVIIPAAQDEIQYLALTLNEMLDSLEHAFLRQRRFVADASHELRTPIAVLRNKADITLLKDRTPQEYVQVLQEVSEESERLGRLIGDLLALARGDEGRTQFNWETVSLNQLVEMVLAYAQPLADELGIHLYAHNIDTAIVRGDETRLIQILMNLVENAIFYTPAGGEVKLSIQMQHETARIIVQDTGIGIAAEHLPHIFERFYRGDQARQITARSSSGLGLAIVDWIIQAHGGSVAVESTIGRGSTFTIILPAGEKQQHLPQSPEVSRGE
jgi:heavy metal sensor kinase